MSSLETSFGRAAECRSALIAVYAIHYQFEAIHPFRDGNGRVGRILIPLMLWRFLRCSLPWVFMSPFLSQCKGLYMDSMLRVSQRGDWDGWIRFALACTSYQVRLTQLRIEVIRRALEQFGDRVSSFPRLPALVDQLPSVPALRAKSVQEIFGVADQTARNDLSKLEELGILECLPGYPKLWHAPAITGALYGDNQALVATLAPSLGVPVPESLVALIEEGAESRLIHAIPEPSMYA